MNLLWKAGWRAACRVIAIWAVLAAAMAGWHVTAVAYGISPEGGPTCALTTTSSTTLGPAPSGMVDVGMIHNASLNPYPTSVFSGDHWLKGFDILMPWNVLQPNPNDPTQFDWTALNRIFCLADRYHKFVILSLHPGLGTPSWVFKQPGVTTIGPDWDWFNYGYNGVSPGKRRLPMPWNMAYLNLWFSVMRQVRAMYGTNTELAAIQVGGPTSVDTEMGLPNHTSGDQALKLNPGGAAAHGSDVKMWQILGYTPDRFVSAWNTTFLAYKTIFKRQYLSLSLFPGLPIGNSSQPDPAELDETRLSVVGVGRADLLGQMMLQSDALQDDGNVKELRDSGNNFIKANCRSVVTGLQTSNPDKVGSISGAMQRGVDVDVRYLEVYQEDVATHSAPLEATAHKLPATGMCKPMTLKTALPSAPSKALPTVTARTDLLLTSDEFVNIYRGTTLVKRCDTSTCKATVARPPAPVEYTADIGAKGVLPSTTQAIESASAELK